MRPWLARLSRPTVWGPLLGLAVGFAVFWVVRDVQVQRARARFERASTDIRVRVEERIRDCEDLLRSVRGLAEARKGELDRDSLRAFLGALDLSRRYPGLLGITFGIPVPPDDRAMALARLRAEQGRPELQVWPGWGDGEAALVILGEPTATNARALGFNSAYSPEQRASLWQARDSGEIQASAPTRVAQAPEAGPGLVLRLAVYRNPADLASEASRRRHFCGYANAVFLCEQLAAEGSKRAFQDGLILSLSDSTETGVQGPFFRGGQHPPARLWHLLAPRGFSSDQMIGVGGRKWRLSLQASPAFFQAGEVGWPVLLGLLALLITLLLIGLQRANAAVLHKARLLAERMTQRLRESESRIRAIAQVTPDAIFVLDAEGIYLEVWSGDPKRLVAPAEDLIGRRVTEVLPGELAGQVLLTIHRALEGGRIQTLDYEAETQRGTLRFEALVAPLEGTLDGRPCVIWVARDVTERRQQEAALLQAQKLDGLGLLAGGIAHDFNNLLAAVQGHLSLARARYEEGGSPDLHFDRMEQSIDRAAALARQLLAYSGRARFQIEPLDLNALVREMADLLGVSVSKKVAVDLVLAEQLPSILGDRAQLQQVVMNLVTNANEAIGDRPGRIELSTGVCRLDVRALAAKLPGQELAPGDYVTLVARDDGPGMSTEVLARIFDPFFTTKSTGRGLGLSAVRGILHSHHGGIEISSRPGEGSLFALYIPVHGGVESRAEAVPDAAEPTLLSGTLLLADDEPTLREVSTQMAERLGFEVIESADGNEAWARFQELGPERLRVAVLDLTMPGLGGLEVHARIRAQAPDFPVLLCSGYSREALPEEEPGRPTGFLQKPFSLAQFKAALEGVLSPRN